MNEHHPFDWTLGEAFWHVSEHSQFALSIREKCEANNVKAGSGDELASLFAVGDIDVSIGIQSAKRLQKLIDEHQIPVLDFPQGANTPEVLDHICLNLNRWGFPQSCFSDSV